MLQIAEKSRARPRQEQEYQVQLFRVFGFSMPATPVDWRCIKVRNLFAKKHQMFIPGAVNGIRQLWRPSMMQRRLKSTDWVDQEHPYQNVAMKLHLEKCVS